MRSVILSSKGLTMPQVLLQTLLIEVTSVAADAPSQTITSKSVALTHSGKIVLFDGSLL